MKITIKGRIPSKKNSRILVCTGRKFPNSFPSKAYTKWHAEAKKQIEQFIPKKPITKCKVLLLFWAPDKRKADLTNKSESIMDLLVDLKFLEDDNWFVVNDIHPIFQKIDKKNPRVEIHIMKPTMILNSNLDKSQKKKLTLKDLK